MGQILYHLMTFPPYVPQEYPKYIRLGDDDAIAVDAEHEAALRTIHANKQKRKPGRPRKS